MSSKSYKYLRKYTSANGNAVYVYPRNSDQTDSTSIESEGEQPKPSDVLNEFGDWIGETTGIREALDYSLDDLVRDGKKFIEKLFGKEG